MEIINCFLVILYIQESQGQKKKCIVVADPKSFSMGVKNLKEQKRNTFLGKIGKVNGE